MLRTLADRGDEREHRLVVAERGDEPLFADELAALGRRLHLQVTRTGGRRIDAALLAEALPGAEARDRLDYFVCGSPSLMAGSLAALEQLGVPATRVHTEQFGWSGALPVADRIPAITAGDTAAAASPAGPMAGGAPLTPAALAGGPRHGRRPTGSHRAR
jgi:ferredoxin-NADP reductase